jgi:hypothetical protein
MAHNKAWCLLIDHDHKPTFGEPFYVPIKYDDTIHDLKVKLKLVWDKIPHITPNEVEIWRCKTLRLSATDSFSRTKKQLGDVKFDGDENSDAEHLGVAWMVMGLGLQQGEILLALVPRNGT